MALSLITNVSSLIAADQLATNQLGLNQSIAQLSSGKRIVTAANDPAGLAVSLELTGLLGGLNQAQTNSSNAQGMLQTADGALSNIGNALNTMQQLANEAADGTINNSQRTALDNQYQALFNEINNIAQSTQFNGINVLQGAAITFQIGALNNSSNQLSVTTPDVTAGTLLGLALPTSGTQLTAGTNVTLNAPGSQTLSLGATNASTSSAANGVATAATNGTLSAAAPNEITLTVTQGGTLGTSDVSFVVKDSNGAVSTPVTLSGSAGDLAITNVDGLGFDLAVGTAGQTYNAGDQITLVFGTSGGTASIATQSAAQSQITQTNNALSTLAGYRGTIGASEQQLQTISANLQSETQNLTSALSNIQDANTAQTFATFTKHLVLQQAGVQVLRQADQAPQTLLTLFQ